MSDLRSQTARGISSPTSESIFAEFKRGRARWRARFDRFFSAGRSKTWRERPCGGADSKAVGGTQPTALPSSPIRAARARWAVEPAVKEPAFTVPPFRSKRGTAKSDRERIACTRRLFCGFAAQPPANVMRAEHGCAFWATFTGYLSIWLARWIDDFGPWADDTRA